MKPLSRESLDINSPLILNCALLRVLCSPSFCSLWIETRVIPLFPISALYMVPAALQPLNGAIKSPPRHCCVQRILTVRGCKRGGGSNLVVPESIQECQGEALGAREGLALSVLSGTHSRSWNELPTNKEDDYKRCF